MHEQSRASGAVSESSFSQPAWILRRNPLEWRQASLPKLHEAFHTTQAVLSTEEAVRIQENRWTERTGLLPQDSSFTLIVPIHNEERSLSSFLGTLMVADIPSQVQANILLISNACSDQSQEIIHDFLGQVGEVSPVDLPESIHDTAVNKKGSFTQIGNIRFTHIDTQTRGKANALNIGNQLARSEGHAIAMSLDANNFLEPDGIAIMFAESYELFDKTDTVLLYKEINSVIENPSLPFRLITARKGQAKKGEASKSVSGASMSWNAKWLTDAGGVPHVASEDYAMGYKARKDGLGVDRFEKVEIWGFGPSSVTEVQSTRARSIRGRFQLMASDFWVKEDIDEYPPSAREVSFRLRRLFQKIKQQPLLFPLHVGDFLLWEHARWMAKRDFKKDPANMSWDPIDSTK